MNRVRPTPIIAIAVGGNFGTGMRAALRICRVATYLVITVELSFKLVLGDVSTGAVFIVVVVGKVVAGNVVIVVVAGTVDRVDVFNVVELSVVAG